MSNSRVIVYSTRGTAGTGTCFNAIKGWGGLIHFKNRRSPTGMSLQVLREDDGSVKVAKDLELDNAQIVSYKSINHDDLYSWKQTISAYKCYR